MNYTLDIKNRYDSDIKFYNKLKDTNPDGEIICCNNFYIERNNQPLFINSAEFHYFRTPNQYWEQEILKLKMSGINTISSYVAWILHEEEENVFDFSGDNDIRKFVSLCYKHDMQFCLRIGPYIHAEIRNGGLPEWLVQKPVKIRSNDPEYLFYAKRYIQNVGFQLQGLSYREGGPIIAIYIENELEYEHEHLCTLKEYINEAGMYAPIYFFTGMINEFDWYEEAIPTGGAYPFPTWGDDITAMSTTWNYLFTNSWKISHSVSRPYYIFNKSVYAITEMGSGIMTSKALRPLVPPNAIPAMVAVKLGSGCNYINYYMYHGGINPVPKSSYFYGDDISPEMTYDFQAPIGEFGQIRDMNGHIKVISLFLNTFGSDLAPLVVSLSEDNDLIIEDNVTSLRYAARSNGRKGYLFINNYQDHAVMTNKKNLKFTLLLEDEEINFPKGKGIDITAEEYAILPFNLEIGGIRIRYATAQPLTTINDCDKTYLIMVSPLGNKTVEFGFDLETIDSISFDEGIGQRFDESTLIVQNKGKNSISLTSKQGEELIIKTISKEEALKAWKCKIGSKEKLIICDLNILDDSEGLKVSYNRNGEYGLKVYPPEIDRLTIENKTVNADREDDFAVFDLHVEQKEISGISIKSVSADRAIISIQKESINDFDEVFLVIDYIGDIAKAYINDTLILDNYYHGEKWEIGLKRYLTDLIANDLIICIRPKNGEGSQSKCHIREISYYGISTLNIKQ